MASKKTSKFAGVADKVTKLRSENEASPALVPTNAAEKKTGRSRGKKTDPNYAQVTVYLRKSVHQAAKKILIDQEREFSELVDDLVSRWLEKPTTTS